MKKNLFIILFFIVALNFSHLPLRLVLAQDLPGSILIVTPEKVQPADGNIKFGLKRLKENIFLALLRFSPAKKVQYLKKLVGVRLSEFKGVIDNNDKHNIEKASQRYFTTVGMLVDFTNSTPKLASEKENIKNLLVKHYAYIFPLKEEFEAGSAEWLFVKQVMDYLVIYKEQL
jgi:hypothetical protein